MKALPVRMARWSAAHSWRGIVGWFVFVVVCLGIGISSGVELVERLAPDVAVLDLRMPVLDGVAATSEIVALPVATAPKVAERLVARMRRPEPVALTARERDVLHAVVDGLSNAEIGRRLVIGEATVTTHLLRVFAKLDVSDRTRAVVVALERGLLARNLRGVRRPARPRRRRPPTR